MVFEALVTEDLCQVAKKEFKKITAIDKALHNSREECDKDGSTVKGGLASSTRDGNQIAFDSKLHGSVSQNCN